MRFEAHRWEGEGAALGPSAPDQYGRPRRAKTHERRSPVLGSAALKVEVGIISALRVYRLDFRHVGSATRMRRCTATRTRRVPCPIPLP